MKDINNSVTDNSAYWDNQTIAFIDNMLNKKGKIRNLIFGDFIKMVIVKLGTCVFNIFMLIEIVLFVVFSIIFGVTCGFGIAATVTNITYNGFLGFIFGLVLGVIIIALLIFVSLVVIICVNYLFYLLINAHDNHASIARSLEIIANNKSKN